jgi:voltage-gated potassium channel
METRHAEVQRQRQSLLRRVTAMLDAPMTILSFVWVGLMIVEFTGELSPPLEALNYGIWTLFVLEFVLEFWIAPNKLRYLRKNWLTALSLLLPALRILRTFRALRLMRAARLSRGVRLVRWLTSVNRGIRATQQAMRRRGLSYVLALTAIIAFGGAAGIYLFENPLALREAGYVGEGSPPTGIGNYGEGLWWTAMMLTTIGTDYFPRSTEGRVLALLVAVYAFAIFGYITATVASLILRVDQADDTAQALASLQRELTELRETLTAAPAKRDRAEQEGLG